MIREHKVALVCLATLLLCAGESDGATIAFDGAGLRTVRGSLGGALPAGSKIRVGYFAGLSDSAIVAAQSNVAELNDRFVPFGLGGAVGQGVGGAAGSFTFNTAATVEGAMPTFVQPSPPNTNQIYIWIFDSNSSPMAASEQAIFTSSLASWRWPVTDDGFTDRSISLDDTVSMVVGSVDADAVYLQPIPEANFALLFGCAAGAVGLRRWKDRSIGFRPA